MFSTFFPFDIFPFRHFYCHPVNDNTRKKNEMILLEKNQVQQKHYYSICISNLIINQKINKRQIVDIKTILISYTVQ